MRAEDCIEMSVSTNAVLSSLVRDLYNKHDISKQTDMNSAMENELVCNIKPTLWVRLFCGIYRDVNPSKRIRLFFKTYCFFIAVKFTCIFFNVMTVVYLKSLCPVLLEYICCIMLSLQIKDEYIIKYYKYMKHIDGIPRAENYASLGFLFNTILVSTFVVSGFIDGIVCFIYDGKCFNFIMLYIIDTAVAFVTVLGRLPLLMIVSLTYCRVKNMLETLEKDKIQRGRKFQPKKYILVYETIMDALEESNYYIKRLIYIFLLTSNMKLIYDTYDIINGIKSSIYQPAPVICYTLKCTWEYNSVLISSVLCDLIKDDIKRIKIIVMEKRMDATNERDRAEIQKLFQLLQTRSFEYTLCRGVSLTCRTVLTFISFIITTIISILQIIDWSK